MPLALIKGRNAIDRGEIRQKEMERWRDGRREREAGCLTSVIRPVCATFITDKPGTHSSKTSKIFKTGTATLKRLQLLVQR